MSAARIKAAEKFSKIVQSQLQDLALPKASFTLRVAPLKEEEKLKKAEEDVIPSEFSYDAIPGLRIELRDKLKRFRPYSVGQAMRIPGMTPSALSLLTVFLKRHKAA